MGKTMGFKKRGWGKEAKTNHFVQVTVLSLGGPVYPSLPSLLLTLAPLNTVIPTCLYTQQERGSQEKPRILFIGQVWQAGEGCPGCCQAALPLPGPA